MAYKVGDKFIIEIDEELSTDTYYGDDTKYKNGGLYRVKGFNSLTFDENGLNKLKKYKESPFTREDCDRARQEGYQEGLNDAWETVRKINNSDIKWVESYFHVDDWICVYEKYTAFEAISKIKTYEEQKKAEEEIKVGDEVEDNKVKEKGVVIAISPEEDDDTGEQIYVLFAKSNYPIDCTRDDISKTGRHFDIEGILKAMRE